MPRPTPAIAAVGRAISRMAGVDLVTFLANDEYKWFWWIAPILVVSFLGIVALLSVGYFRKVLLPRYRGRRVEE